MTDAPDRIWACYHFEEDTNQGGEWLPNKDGFINGVKHYEYISLDHLRTNLAEHIRAKTLVWKKDPDPEEYSRYGAYMAKVSTGYYRIEPRDDDQWYLWYPRNNDTMDKKCKSFEAAKAAAQAHRNQMLIDMMEVI